MWGYFYGLRPSESGKGISIHSSTLPSVCLTSWKFGINEKCNFKLKNILLARGCKEGGIITYIVWHYNKAFWIYYVKLIILLRICLFWNILNRIIRFLFLFFFLKIWDSFEDRIYLPEICKQVNECEVA